MKKLFIHNPLFRLLSPLFSGVIVYLFILLVNNNVAQLQEQFLTEELYICIGLSFLIQELSRLLLLLFKRFSKTLSLGYSLLFQVGASLLVCVGVVTFSINQYFNYTLGYAPNTDELWLFNSIFCTVTLIYILLHVSHEYLHKVNSKRLNEEMLRKQLIEEDFIEFKNAIKPDLLFNSLESVITLLQSDSHKIDDLIDHMATTYRYILTQGQRQLVQLEEELLVLDDLVQLIEYLPFRNITITNNLNSSFLIVPGSLLNIVEQIIKHSITTINEPLQLALNETQDYINISYTFNDKIISPFQAEDLNDIKRVYEIYSTNRLNIEESARNRIINLPKLYLKE